MPFYTFVFTQPLVEIFVTLSTALAVFNKLIARSAPFGKMLQWNQAIYECLS